MNDISTPAHTKLRKISDEEWKFIPSTNEKYMISNYGRVKSFTQNTTEGKIVKQGNIKNYKCVNLKIHDKRKTFLTHRLVAEIFLPREEHDNMVVIHKDWNKGNNHVSNLQWLNKEESFNRAHGRMIKGRKKRGRIVTHAKLSESDVSMIKSMLKNGRQQKVIAQLFCVSEMQISRIKNNKSWTTIQTMN